MKKKTEIVQWKIPPIPNEKALAKQSESLLARANSFVIKSEDHFVASAAIIQELDRGYDQFEQMLDPFCVGLDKMHKAACRLRDGFLKPMKASKKRMHDIRVEWIEKQEEIKRKADAAAAEALRKVQQQELERQAKLAVKAGQPEVAAALREEKTSMPLPFLNPTPAVPKQAGFVVTERWCYEVVDPAAVERKYCSPDDSIIRPIVMKLGDKAGISGLRIWLEKGEHSRTVA